MLSAQTHSPLLNELSGNEHQYRWQICLWSAPTEFSLKKKLGWRTLSNEQEDKRQQNLVQQRFGDKTILVLTSENFKLTFSIISPSFWLFLARLSSSREAGSSWAPIVIPVSPVWIAFTAFHFGYLKCLLTKDVSYFPRINCKPNIWQRENTLRNSPLMDTTFNINNRPDTPHLHQRGSREAPPTVDQEQASLSGMRPSAILPPCSNPCQGLKESTRSAWFLIFPEVLDSINQSQYPPGPGLRSKLKLGLSPSPSLALLPSINRALRGGQQLRVPRWHCLYEQDLRRNSGHLSIPYPSNLSKPLHRFLPGSHQN